MLNSNHIFLYEQQKAEREYDRVINTARMIERNIMNVLRAYKFNDSINYFSKEEYAILHSMDNSKITANVSIDIYTHLIHQLLKINGDIHITLVYVDRIYKDGNLKEQDVRKLMSIVAGHLPMHYVKLEKYLFKLKNNN